jgi:hypothetical protein
VTGGCGYCGDVNADLYALQEAARLALATLENLTTEAFERGGDRPAREALARALAPYGLITLDQADEYAPSGD